MSVQSWEAKDRIPATLPLLHTRGPPESPCRSQGTQVTLSARWRGPDYLWGRELIPWQTPHGYTAWSHNSLFLSPLFIYSFFPPQGLCTSASMP